MYEIAKNLILFKIAWLACVLGAANGAAWLGPVVVTGVVVEHLRTMPFPRREVPLLLLAAALGLAWESALIGMGYVQYVSGSIAIGSAPYWIVAMWVLFATTLNVGLSWLKRHYLLAAVAGAVCGPAAFFAGAQAGAVVFPNTAAALLAIGLGWALMLPVLVAVARECSAEQARASRSPGST